MCQAVCILQPNGLSNHVLESIIQFHCQRLASVNSFLCFALAMKVCFCLNSFFEHHAQVIKTKVVDVGEIVFLV